MATLNVEKISNGTVSVNGVVIWGAPAEINFEKIQAKVSEYASLGMIGTAEFFSGIEKMAATVKFKHVNQALARQFGDMTRSLQMQFRTNKEKFATAGRVNEVPLVYKMTATPKSFPGVTIVAQEAAEFEMDFSVNALTIEENGVEIFHFDALANTYRVDGVDLLATYRSNLGI